MMTVKPKVIKKGGKQRFGRGFSREELKKAGISLKEALKLGVPVDSRRKTAHQENIETLKAFLESKREKEKPKSQQ
ncbi:MAG: ribosomal protein L13e [Candidatus Bathyarchaeia archaeon]